VKFPAPLLAVAVLTVSGCALPRWPVEGALTSPFGLRLQGLRPDIHRGVDLEAPEGTEVRAMSAGTVRFAGVMRGYGKVVWLEHGHGVLSVYAHLSQIRVSRGDRLDGAAVIGLSGSTGDVTGPHLHFEIWRWGRQVDPVPLLGGRLSPRL
jgi:murein DD-endopeptidase MepM/ murein hydrolase activator NlpD